MDLIYRFDPYQPLLIDRPVDAASATAQLLEGNQRFIEFVTALQGAVLGEQGSDSSVVIPIDLMTMGLPLLPGITLDQRPFAFVLGCSDARVPIEQLFDLSFNSLFVVRIAGNVLGTECLGSFDYAVRNFSGSLRLIVVLGHSGCGAVTAAVDAFLHPADHARIAATHALRSLVDRVLIAVQSAAHELERQEGAAIRANPRFREMLLQSSVFINAAITAYDLAREARALNLGELAVKYGVCDLGSFVVRARPARPDQDDPPSLGLAPMRSEDFVELTERIVRDVLAAHHVR
jgi:carbonic anhydrase